MPIYEFYCHQCNTIYKFFSRTINTKKIPFCPKCQNIQLKRQMSLFATLNSQGDRGEEADMPPLDENKMEKAMSMLASEADQINEEDPRQAAHLMRKLSDMTGLSMGPGMEEALNRMEKGENPEKIEEEMGEILETEEPFILKGKKKKITNRPKPKIEDTLYEL